MSLGRIILQLERARRRLVSADCSDYEKLLKISREVDRLVLEYYRRASLSKNA